MKYDFSTRRLYPFSDKWENGLQGELWYIWEDDAICIVNGDSKYPIVKGVAAAIMVQKGAFTGVSCHVQRKQPLVEQEPIRHRCHRHHLQRRLQQPPEEQLLHRTDGGELPVAAREVQTYRRRERSAFTDALTHLLRPS